VTFWCGSGSLYPYVLLMDLVPDPAPDLDPDPTPFSIDLKYAKKFIFFPYFFLITCPQAHHFQSIKFNLLLKFDPDSYF